MNLPRVMAAICLVATLSACSENEPAAIRVEPIRPPQIICIKDIGSDVTLHELVAERGLSVSDFRRAHIIFPQLESKPTLRVESDGIRDDDDGFKVQTFDFYNSFAHDEVETTVKGGSEVWLRREAPKEVWKDYSPPPISLYDEHYVAYSDTASDQKLCEKVTGLKLSDMDARLISSYRHSGAEHHGRGWLIDALDESEILSRIEHYLPEGKEFVDGDVVARVEPNFIRVFSSRD